MWLDVETFVHCVVGYFSVILFSVFVYSVFIAWFSRAVRKIKNKKTTLCQCIFVQSKFILLSVNLFDKQLGAGWLIS